MARRREAGDAVDRQTASCDRLAVEIRGWANAGRLSKRDAVFLEGVAQQLEALAKDIRQSFESGQPSGVRRAVTFAGWVVLGFAVPAATITSGAKDVRDWIEGDPPKAVVVEANRCIDAGHIVLSFSDQDFVPEEITGSIDIQVDDLTSSNSVGTVEVTPSTATARGQAHDATVRIEEFVRPAEQNEPPPAEQNGR